MSTPAPSPRRRKVLKPRPKPVDPTDPGDSIEVSITQEVKNAQGRSFWAKAGVVSKHRDGETTEEAYLRIEGFVVERIEDLVRDYLS